VISGRSLCTRIITNLFVLLSPIMVTGPWNVPYPESTLHMKSFLFIVWNGGVAVWITVILVAMLDSSLKMRTEMRMHKKCHLLCLLMYGLRNNIQSSNFDVIRNLRIYQSITQLFLYIFLTRVLASYLQRQESLIPS
jgi:hypothetical protein